MREVYVQVNRVVVRPESLRILISHHSAMMGDDGIHLSIEIELKALEFDIRNTFYCY